MKDTHILSKIYTLFWVSVFTIIMVLGVVIGSFALKGIKQPTFVQIIEETKTKNEIGSLNEEMAKLRNEMQAMKDKRKN